jgi:hypothetical protein
MAKVCKDCKRPIPKGHSTCPHCAAEEAAALAALGSDEPTPQEEENPIELADLDAEVSEVAEEASADSGIDLDAAVLKEQAPASGDSSTAWSDLVDVLDSEEEAEAPVEIDAAEDADILVNASEGPVPGESAVDLANLEPVSVEQPSSIKLAELDHVEDVTPPASGEALLAEEEPVAAQESSAVNLAEIDEEIVEPLASDSGSGTVHLAEIEEAAEEPVMAEEETPAESSPVIDLGSVADMALLGEPPAEEEAQLEEEAEVAEEAEEEAAAEVDDLVAELNEPVVSERPSELDLASAGDEALAVESGGSGNLRVDEGQSALNLANFLEEDPAQVMSSNPSGLAALDLSAAQDETLAVEPSPSGTNLTGDVSLEEDELAEEALDTRPRTATPSVSDLNLVSEALEPGTSSAYLGTEAEKEPLAGEFTEPAEEEVLAEEESLNLEELTASPDIVEQVESGVDLYGKQGAAPAEEEEAVEEPGVSEEEESVDLGATEAEDEAAALLGESAVNLEETQAVEQEEPALDDLESAAEETREMEAQDEAPEEGTFESEKLDLGEEPAAEEEEAVEEQPEEEEAPAPKRERRRGGVLTLVCGLFFGLLLGAGGLYGALQYKLLDGVVPAEYLPGYAAKPPGTNKQTGTGKEQGTQPKEEPGFEKAHALLQDGEFSKALPMLETLGGQEPEKLAKRGEARFMARLQELSSQPNADLSKLGEDPEVKKAKEELTQANTADAAFWLAQIEEMSGKLEEARKLYQQGHKDATPAQKVRFESAAASVAARLGLQAQAKAGGGMSRNDSELRFWVALALVSMQAGGGGADPKQGGGGNPPDGNEEEAGPLFFKALTLAQEGKFDQAIESLKEARKRHDKRRILRMRKPQNPNSDPTETIFLLACDEIALRWQLENSYRDAKVLKDAGYAALADELAKQPSSVKALDSLMTGLKGVADKLKLKDDEKKALKIGALVDSIGATDKALANERAKVEAVIAELKAADADKFKDLTADKATKDDLADGVKSIVEARTAEREKVAAVVAELKTAGVEKFKDLTADKATKADLADGVKELGVEKQKVKAVVAKLITAGVKKFKDLKDPAEFKGNATDLAAGVEDLAGDRDTARTELAAANGLLDEAMVPLIESKHLPKDAKRKDVPAGVQALRVTADHPVVRGLAQVTSDLGGMSGKAGNSLLEGINVRSQLAALGTDNVRLQGELANRWPAERLLPVWLKVMQFSPGKEATEMALADVKRVTAEKPQLPDALCVQALADRNARKFAEARSQLQDLLKTPAPNPKPVWREVTEGALAELTDPHASYLPGIQRMRAEGELASALTVADEALEVFSPEGFKKENSGLHALRGLVRLELLRKTNKGKLKPEQLKDVALDAEAAVGGGDTVEGNYLAGRIAEEQGDMAKAEAAYRAALEACRAAEKGQGFDKDHLASDATGHRYRAALARVLLAQAGGGAVGGFRQERPNEGGEGGRQDRPNKGGGAGGQDAPRGEGFLQDAPAGGRGVVVAYQSPPLLVWTGCGCAGVLAMPVLLADPAAVVDVEGMGQPPDPRLEETIKLARESIKRAEAGEGDENYEGYLILGEALGRKHKWTDGLMAYVEGLKHRCSRYSAGLVFLVSNHPAFKRLDSLELPDPLQAEAYYAKGLRFYFDRRYEDAERELLDALHYSDQDARYQYFLGLARLAQPGKRDLALEDFRQAARLEKQDKPNRYAVSAALEKVQGPARRILNEVRDRAR